MLVVHIDMEQQTSVEAKKGPMLTCLISLQLSKEHAKAKNAKETRFSKFLHIRPQQFMLGLD